MRILFVDVEGYKEQAIDWLAAEYEIDANVDGISAGVDFSGVYLSLNNLTFLEGDRLPFLVKAKHLFLHLDFWESLTKLAPAVSKVSIVGVDLDLTHQVEETQKVDEGTPSKDNASTLTSIQDILLTKLNEFSISYARVHYLDKFKTEKTILIKTLRWANKDDLHQGVGEVKLNGEDSGKGLSFVVNVTENKEKVLSGELYLQANKLNLLSYVKNQTNSHAKVSSAKLDGQVWLDFTANRISNIQIKMDDIDLAWHFMNKSHHWKLQSGSLQLTNTMNGWLLDTYDLDILNNNKKIENLSISAVGDKTQGSVNFTGVNISKAIPLYQLISDLPLSTLKTINKLNADAKLTQVKFSKNEKGERQAGFSLRSFKNKPVGGIPGLSNVQIDVFGDINSGIANIRLPKQKIYFDGEFNRPFPVKSADIPLQWLSTETGIKIFSEKALLVTNELDTISAFSMFFGNEKAQNPSPFLSLYTYANLNNAGQADHYYPINAMGLDVYDYLLPTLKKGTVKGAKILWYGAFSDYPYANNDGIFQAYVPVKNATFNFYDEWEGLTKLNVDLLFENDWLTMNAKNATLGELNVDKVYGKIDRLHPEGILTINAELTEDAQKATAYLSRSPYKDSVGSALKIIDVHDDLKAKLKIVIPFNRKKHKTQIFGDVTLHNNAINLKLADGVEMPLEKVNGSFSFVDGDLKTKNVRANYLQQPLSLSVTSKEQKSAYKINAKLSAKWDLNKLKNKLPLLEKSTISGELDWKGKVAFSYDYGNSYLFDVNLDSVLQNVETKLPAPFNKNIYQKWPLNISLKGNNNGIKATLTLAEKLALEGKLKSAGSDLQLSYLDVQVGKAPASKKINTQQQNININLPQLDIGAWYAVWNSTHSNTSKSLQKSQQIKRKENPLIKLNTFNADIGQVLLFNQPLDKFKAVAAFNEKKIQLNIESDQLVTDVSYRQGMPDRFDIAIGKLDFNHFELPAEATHDENESKETKVASIKSENMRKDYPEVFLKCDVCLWNEMDFSPMTMHVYPTKSRFKIEYLTIGEGDEFTSVSGVWDQKRTNVVIDTSAKNNQSIVQRLKYTSPLTFKTANVNGAINWIGAPWAFNTKTLSGTVSLKVDNGSVTEVNDRGARLLSVFSLDGIRRTLNLEYGNLFDKGFNFDVITMTSHIRNGVFKTDDFYLDGSAGKIVGKGLVDLPNETTNLTASYSPAISGSLPVLAAFVISPITGAAALVISKLVQPAVESIVRVDFSVKGDLSDPVVEIVGQKRGMVKLEDTEALEDIEDSVNN